MNDNLAQQAISCAIKGSWQEAVDINLKILKDNPKDIDSLNRLAKAYAETGNFKQARIYATKVLDFDSYNSIATKSLEKWKSLKKSNISSPGPPPPQIFLEEPGKTKVVLLINLGCKEACARLDAGDEVFLNTHSHKISVATKDKDYIGRLPDDLSAKLRKLIKHGNEYRAFIKSTDKNEVKVFIRETKRSKDLSDIPSFSAEKIDYISFTPPNFVHQKDIILEPNEEEEE